MVGIARAILYNNDDDASHDDDDGGGGGGDDDDIAPWLDVRLSYPTIMMMMPLMMMAVGLGVGRVITQYSCRWSCCYRK